MKTVSTIILSLLATATYALASGGGGVEGLGLLTTLFIALGVLIVLFQFVPGLMLLSGILKDMFSQVETKALDVGNK